MVFSPFGLGILDLAVARTVLAAADRAGIGGEAAGFDPGRHGVTAAPAGGTA